ncbi:MAG: hypothetical protein ACRDNS_02155 [Trebonia sp.]
MRFRSDQARIQFSVQGVSGLDSVSWQTFDGGEITPESQVSYPGGMEDGVSLGGLRKRGPITIARTWDSTLIAAFIALDNAAGRAPCRVSVTTLDAQKHPTGSPLVWTGTLDKVAPPKRDSTDSKDAMLSITISTNVAMGG